MDIKMPTVNNVTRFLDSRKVSYAAFETPVEKMGALETAEFLNVPPEMVFKTIVVTRDKPRKPVLAVIPGTGVVDLKLLAAFLGEKKVHLPTEREAEGLTGLQAGGISPLALINKASRWWLMLPLKIILRSISQAVRDGLIFDYLSLS
jgi:Cys-tRNA(Pro)/Cys-tRNA(Cys) deacylase